MNKTFTVRSAGRLHGDINKEKSTRILKESLNMPEEKIAILLEGKKVTIKKNISSPDAERLRNIFEDAGIFCEIINDSDIIRAKEMGKETTNENHPKKLSKAPGKIEKSLGYKLFMLYYNLFLSIFSGSFRVSAESALRGLAYIFIPIMFSVGFALACGTGFKSDKIVLWIVSVGILLWIPGCIIAAYVNRVSTELFSSAFKNRPMHIKTNTPFMIIGGVIISAALAYCAYAIDKGIKYKEFATLINGLTILITSGYITSALLSPESLNINVDNNITQKNNAAGFFAFTIRAASCSIPVISNSIIIALTVKLILHLQPVFTHKGAGGHMITLKLVSDMYMLAAAILIVPAGYYLYSIFSIITEMLKDKND